MKKEDLLKGEDYVECETCGHIISRNRAQIVTVSDYMFGDVTQHFYCETDKKPYDRIKIFGLVHRIFFRDMEVSEDGAPIGYKKISEKK